ncbi:MAG: T9SS type A sorting domain-containing protein [Salibacteraceae bacterium]
MKRIVTLFYFTTLALAVLAQAPRTSLLELSESVFTRDVATTICLKEELRNSFNNDLAILSYHPDDFQGPQFSEDPFFNNSSDQWWNIYGTPGFGQGFIDRVSYNGNNLVLGRSRWNDTIASRINRTSIALVTLPEVLYDPAKREIFARIQIDFEKENIELKDFRFFLYITANEQLGFQRFDTTDSGLCVDFIDPSDTNFFMTDTLDTFYHNDVVIASPSTYEGVDNIIPNEVDEGARYTTTFTYTVPNKYALDDLKVVGFVADYNENDVTRNAVINAAQSVSFIEYDSEDPKDPNHPENPDNPNSVKNPNYWPTGSKTIFNDEVFGFYPNPMRDLGVLSFSVPTNQHVEVGVYNIQGKLIKQVYSQDLSAGTHKAAFTNNGISNGVYIVKVKGESFQRQLRVVIL